MSAAAGAAPTVSAAVPAPPAASVAGVLLLKERGGARVADATTDAYEQAFRSAAYAVRFLPPLSFRPTTGSQAALSSQLRAGRASSGIVALIATSPRGAAALRTALVTIGDEQRMHRLWATTPVFVVGAASAAALHACESDGAGAGADVARRCGFEACHGGDAVRNATELGALIRSRWPSLCSVADSRSSPTSSPHLLALVGDRRRDELFTVLAGAPGTGDAVNEGSSSVAATVPVVELEVYQTVVATDSEDSSTPASFAVDLAVQLESLTTATRSPTDPLYVAIFSPSGAQTYFGQLASLRAAATANSSSSSPHATLWRRIERLIGRIHLACIGQTSAQAVDAWFAERGQPAPRLLVSAHPNAGALLQCIDAARSADSTSSLATAATPPP
jgi:uroporphyrinogen-III synthase